MLPDERLGVLEARHNRHGTYYAMSDSSMLSVPHAVGEPVHASGRRVNLFPLTTVEELGAHLQWVRNRNKRATVEAYLDYRYACTHRQFSTSTTAGAYAPLRLPTGPRGTPRMGVEG